MATRQTGAREEWLGAFAWADAASAEALRPH
jgi:hypothetical protein